MKKIITSIVLLTFLLGGCTSNESVTEPTQISSQQQIPELPDADVVFEKSRIFSQEIDGTVGGNIQFSMNYKSKGHTISISGTLEIPAGAFGATRDISLILNSKKAMIDLYPSPMSFDIPLKLDLCYQGLDLRRLTIDQIDFYYLNEFTNTYELMNSAGKVFDASTGLLGITGVEIPHFSRYIWVR